MGVTEGDSSIDIDVDDVILGNCTILIPFVIRI